MRLKQTESFWSKELLKSWSFCIEENVLCFATFHCNAVSPSKRLCNLVAERTETKNHCVFCSIHILIFRFVRWLLLHAPLWSCNWVVWSFEWRRSLNEEKSLRYRKAFTFITYWKEFPFALRDCFSEYEHYNWIYKSKCMYHLFQKSPNFIRLVVEYTGNPILLPTFFFNLKWGITFAWNALGNVPRV